MSLMKKIHDAMNPKTLAAYEANTDYRKWATEPRSQAAVDLMFSDPPMLAEIDIATKNGFISGKNWVPPEKRGR